LQSPVVILADACGDPERKGGFGQFARMQLAEDEPPIPIFRPRKDELVEPLRSQVETRDRLEREEHHRLLYVAMTRAEERLFVGGALGAGDSGAPTASWYQAVDSALAGLGAEWGDDPLWGRARIFGDPQARGPAPPRPAERSLAEPLWLRRAAPEEARPPRPLAPSAPAEEEMADPPPSPALRAAALRGKLLHALFERLAEVPPEERFGRADNWLEHSAGVADIALRRELVEAACRIVGDPGHAELFGPEALAEAPIAAVLADGLVVSGTIDRLLVGDERILFADFKTGRKVPADADHVPAPHLRQMAAYAETLKAVFPGRRVEAKLLYTSGPRLIDLPAALLDRHRPRAASAQSANGGEIGG
jgi:ATP-dependent helicase/nuclease subunit A